MKKLFILVLLSSSLFVFAACGTKEITETIVDANSEDVQKSENGEEGKFKTTMENILKKGKTTTCTFTITEDGQTFNGILYVDGKKMRYTSKGTIAGKTFETNVITKEGFSYSWTNMDVKGFKMKDTQGEDNNDEDVGAEERVQEMDFDCKKGVENGTFELPSAIEFSEFTIPVAK